MAKCENCGADLASGASVCEKCGTLVLQKSEPETEEKATPQKEEAKTEKPKQPQKDLTDEFEPSDIAQNKTKAALCYAWIFVLIAVFEADDSEFVRFHRRQGLLLFAVEALYFAQNMILLSFLHDYYNGVPVLIVGFMMYSGLIALVALNVYGIITAAKGKAPLLPLLGPLAEKLKIKDK